MATYTKQDYYEEESNGAWALNSPNDWVAQTFQAGSSYSLGKIELLLARVGDAEDLGTITVDIQGVDGDGKPDGVSKGSTTITPTDIPEGSGAYDWVSAVFSSTVSITLGDSYAIVLHASGANVSDYILSRYLNPGDYDNGATIWSTNGGASWSVLGYDNQFRTYAINTTPTDKQYSNTLVTFGGSTCYYQTDSSTLTELAAASGGVNTNDPLTVAVAFEKVFVANKGNLKVADFGNHKFTTDDIAPTDKTCPSRGDLLVGVTSSAEMIVDLITATNGAATVYGKVTNGSFVNGETVRVGDGSTTEFVLTSDGTAGPHWYDWIPYGNDETNYGALPDYAYLVARYRGRLVLAGNKDYPHQWYASKVGNPWDWNYDSTDPLTAIAGQDGGAGEVGDIITALIPFGDDFMIIGCATSLWMMNGDPAAGGSIDEVDNTTGIAGFKAWTKDNLGNLYFFGSGGVYKLVPGSTKPENISITSLPEWATEWAYNPSTHRISLHFDPVNYGIIVCRTTLETGANTAYWYDLRTGGWFPENYPDNCGPFCSLFFDADNPSNRRLLLGSFDGYVRYFDAVAKNDDDGASDTAINSYMVYPITHLAEDDDLQGKLTSLVFEAAGGAASGSFGDPDQFTYSLYVGNDPETVLEDIKDGATARETGTVTTTGLQTRIRKRVRGAWLGLKISDNTAGKTWCINKAYGTIKPAGKVRV